jgi:hypothetical protein
MAAKRTVAAGCRGVRPSTLDRYRGPNENFVLVGAKSSSELQADGGDQFIRGGSDRLVELVELMQPIGGHGLVSWVGMQKPGGEWCVNLIEEFEKQQTMRYPLGRSR